MLIVSAEVLATCFQKVFAKRIFRHRYSDERRQVAKFDDGRRC